MGKPSTAALEGIALQADGLADRARSLVLEPGRSSDFRPFVAELADLLRCLARTLKGPT